MKAIRISKMKIDKNSFKKGLVETKISYPTEELWGKSMFAFIGDWNLWNEEAYKWWIEMGKRRRI